MKKATGIAILGLMMMGAATTLLIIKNPITGETATITYIPPPKIVTTTRTVTEKTVETKIVSGTIGEGSYVGVQKITHMTTYTTTETIYYHETVTPATTITALVSQLIKMNVTETIKTTSTVVETTTKTVETTKDTTTTLETTKHP